MGKISENDTGKKRNYRRKNVDNLNSVVATEIGNVPPQATDVGTGANVEYYVRILPQKAIQRNLIEASYGILKDAFDPSMPVDDLVATAQDTVYNAIAGNLKNPYKHVSEVINLSMERIERSRTLK